MFLRLFLACRQLPFAEAERAERRHLFFTARDWASRLAGEILRACARQRIGDGRGGVARNHAQSGHGKHHLRIPNAEAEMVELRHSPRIGHRERGCAPSQRGKNDLPSSVASMLAAPAGSIRT